MPGFLSSASRYWRRGHFPGGASKINLILDNLYAIGKIKKMMGLIRSRLLLGPARRVLWKVFPLMF